MGLRKRLVLKRAGLKPVHHYAPDIHLSSVDYVFPISALRRLRKSEKDINDFLSNTNPDEFNGSFFDTITEREEEVLKQTINEQFVWHNAVNQAIAISHQSELIRLDRAIEQAEYVIKQLDIEIEELKALYNECN